MATLNLGRIKPVFRGAWTTGAYVIDDIVTHGNESFICIQAGTNIATSNASYWTKLAAKGADGTDVGATITTQGDLLYRDGSGLQRLAKGTALQQLRMNSGATAPEWATISGGDVQLVTHSTNISNQSEIGLQDVFTTDYTYYQVIFESIYSSSEGQMRANLYSSGSTVLSGNSYISTGMETGRATGGNNYNSHRNHHDTYIEVQDNFAANSAYPSHMVWEFWNPLKSGQRPTFRYYHACWSGTGWLEEKDMAVTYNDTTTFTGMRLFTNGANTTCNSLKIYGYK